MSRPRVLVLGGTQFIGRATVEALLASSEQYDITIVTRGRTPSPFDSNASVRHVLCDRRNGDALRALLASDTRHWYAVVDFLAFEPDDVRPILGIFQRLRHKAVDSIRLVGCALEKAFEKDRGQLPRPALGCVGMHGVK